MDEERERGRASEREWEGENVWVGWWWGALIVNILLVIEMLSSPPSPLASMACRSAESAGLYGM